MFRLAAARRIPLTRAYANSAGGAPGGPPGAAPHTPPGIPNKKPDNTPVLIIGALAAGGLAYYMFGGKSNAEKATDKAHGVVNAVGAKADELEKKAKDALGK